jgi:small conductance mechanosensitive channel
MSDEMKALFYGYLQIFGAMVIQYVPRVILALITLWVGFFVVRIVIRAMDRAFSHQRLDRTLAEFLKSFVGIILKILVVVTVATMIGVQMASFIALIGAASLAVGLSLQGSLSNFAGGILILTFKPFKVGDEIEVLGQKGIVARIEIFYTLVEKGDGVAIIPNGALSNGVIVNHSRKAKDIPKEPIGGAPSSGKK